MAGYFQAGDTARGMGSFVPFLMRVLKNHKYVVGYFKNTTFVI